MDGFSHKATPSPPFVGSDSDDDDGDDDDASKDDDDGDASSADEMFTWTLPFVTRDKKGK